MTDTHQIQQDLQYVREAVARTEKAEPRGRAAIYWIWALYVLIGYPLLDFAPRYASPFFMVAFVVCMGATAFISHRSNKMVGVRVQRGRATLFWMGGASLLIFCAIGITNFIPGVSKHAAGQITVVLVGFFYFLSGVHFDRNFLWLGPLLCAGGLLVGFVPHYGWTALGIVFALGLVGPTLLAPRPAEIEGSSTAE